MAPNAFASVDAATGVEGFTASFSASASTDSDGDISEYAWDFDGDGSVDATTQDADFTYDTRGEFTATLTVTDDDGASDSATLDIVVNRAPRQFSVVDYSGDISGSGLIIVLDDEGGEVREIAPDGLTGLQEFQYAPDGSAFVFIADPGDDAFGVLYASQDGAAPEQIASGNGDPAQFANLGVVPGLSWAPDSSEIAYLLQTPGRVDVMAVKPDGTMRRAVTSEATPDLPTVNRFPEYTEDGSYLIFSGQNQTGLSFAAQSLDDPSSPARTVVAARSDIQGRGDFQISDTSARFCYQATLLEPDEPRRVLYVADASQPAVEPTEVSRFINGRLSCAWLPDTDAYIWFETAADGTVSLLRQDAADFSAPTVYSTIPATIVGAVSLDVIKGEFERVLFIGDTTGDNRFRLFVTGERGVPVEVDSRAIFNYRASPDAERVAYLVRNGDAPLSLEIFTFASGERVSVDLGLSDDLPRSAPDYRWSDDGDRLAIALRVGDGDTSSGQVLVADTATGETSLLLERPGRLQQRIAFQPRP